jgi:hypothetical protein
MMARVLGLLLHVHGDALDWGTAEQYVDPVAGQPPSGTRPGPGAERRPADAAPLAAPQPAASPTPAEHHAVGCEAARAGDFPRAVRALKLAAFSQDGVACKALLALAQVYGDGLSDRDAAERLYREAIKRFPRTPGADFAARKLAEL